MEVGVGVGAVVATDLPGSNLQAAQGTTSDDILHAATAQIGYTKGLGKLPANGQHFVSAQMAASL